MDGQVLKRLRECRGLTQEQVAHRVGVKREYIAMLEAGTRANPSLMVLERLAKALGVSTFRLIEGGRRK